MVSFVLACRWSSYDAPRSSLAWDTGTPASVSQLPPCVIEMEEGGTPLYSSHELTSSSVSGCGATISATCSLERCAPYLQMSSGTREYMRARRGVGGDVLWTLWIADLV